MARKSRISLIYQEKVLKSYFPNSVIHRNREEEFTWVHFIKPSHLSNSYKIKLRYKRNKGVKVYVLEPKPLKLAEGKTKLPHVYSTPKQQLCLYYPKDQEWDVSMYYAKTIVPWASEWLLHYELWLATGEWLGGGIEHNEDEINTSNGTQQAMTTS